MPAHGGLPMLYQLTRPLAGTVRPGVLPAAARRAALTALTALLLGLATGCAPSDNPNAPPAIRYGEDVSVSCGMIISDIGYAAAYRTAAGEVRLFDEPGAMVLYHREHRESVASFWVHDVNTREWLRAEDAHYVLSHALRTPMGAGVAAVATDADARALAERVQGQVFTFPDLLDRADIPDGSRH